MRNQTKKSQLSSRSDKEGVIESRLGLHLPVSQLWLSLSPVHGAKMAVLSSSALSMPCSSEVRCHFDEPMRCIEAVGHSWEITDELTCFGH